MNRPSEPTGVASSGSSRNRRPSDFSSSPANGSASRIQPDNQPTELLQTSNEPTDSEQTEMEQVVRQYQSGLLHYAHHLCRRFSWACDVVQETFTKLWEHHQAGKRFESESHRRAWLYRVCRQRAIDLYRKEQRMSSIETEQVPDPVSSDPAQLAELKDQQDQLERQLESLTNKQQEIVRLKFHAGLSYQEIAQVTGLTVTNVGYQLHTAISKLKDRLGPAT